MDAPPVPAAGAPALDAQGPSHAHQQAPRPPVFRQPGPTNIPDSVLRAMDRPSIDFNDPDFVEVYEEAFAGVKRVLRTSQHLFMYNASGHGAWEASLTNLLSPGDTILVLETGLLLRPMGRDGRGPRPEGADTRRPTGAWAPTSRLCATRCPPIPARRDQGGLRSA